jgi:hypothetical protein
VVVDANVFHGFFQMHIGKAHCLCGCPQTLLSTAASSNPVFHDTGGIVEHEWRNVVDIDWFDAWLASSLLSGTIQYIAPKRDVSLEKQLHANGFPGGRDIVYVRVSLAVAAAYAKCDFYTEDIDFYDPKLKGCKAASRLKLLTSSGGPVAKLLAKHDIDVQCVP